MKTVELDETEHEVVTSIFSVVVAYVMVKLLANEDDEMIATRPKYA